VASSCKDDGGPGNGGGGNNGGEELPIFSVSANNLNFGEVRLSTSKDLSMVISNDGNASLVVNSIESNNESFHTSFAGPLTIEPAGNEEITITFTTDSVGRQEAALTIISNDTSRSPYRVTLSGTGTGHFPDPKNTGKNMSIIITTISDFEAKDMDEIGCLTPDGTIAGKVVLQGNPAYGLAVWGDDESTEEIEGFSVGQELKFQYWDNAGERVYETEMTIIQGSSMVYELDGFLVLSMKVIIP